ncbi:MAG: UDP-N-acetylmuramate dehydrogenase [Acidobacteria bacterium]|nr:MAG: UDP-N-acetylmuramate dehydrogenase [Acidobacteriota bacterium]GIK78803.1 MAG: UDP-N-acetylenolpyruvoylglucosamine reductase [Actinomycetes bacterium]
MSAVPLAELTTLRLGGPARRLVEAGSGADLIAAVSAADRGGEPLLLVAGGSNLVVADAGFDGVAVRVRTRGVEAARAGDRVRLTVAAGEPWDELVARCVADGLAGIECLSGIPGSAGATPVQNVGAYGQEVARALVSVRAYDREAGETVVLDRGRCGFGYRSSAFRGSARFVILELTLELEATSTARPVAYAQLAAELGVEAGARPPLGAVREAVLALRRAKGMVVDPADPDSVSAGSFFTNPILDAAAFAELERRAAARLGAGNRPPAWPAPGGAVKTSAAWLIERAGFGRGYGAGAVGVSAKHTLALVNRGGGTTTELLELARELRDGVRAAFGVTLAVEPTLVGVAL